MEVYYIVICLHPARLVIGCYNVQSHYGAANKMAIIVRHYCHVQSRDGGGIKMATEVVRT
jgi:hypothetical protein